MRVASITTLSVVAACGPAAEAPRESAEAATAIPAVLDAPFDLPFGGTARIQPGGLEIEFRALAEESRCPPDVRCPSAGSAAAVFGIEAVGGSTSTLTLHTGRAPRAAGTFGHVVRLEGLAPGPPPVGAPVDTALYVATLVVTEE